MESDVFMNEYFILIHDAHSNGYNLYFYNPISNNIYFVSIDFDSLYEVFSFMNIIYSRYSESFYNYDTDGSKLLKVHSS